MRLYLVFLCRFQWHWHLVKVVKIKYLYLDDVKPIGSIQS